jgi:autotransporter passenger strand-loop-strand repeat protein
VQNGGLLVIENGGTAGGTHNYGGISTSGSPGEEVLSGGQSIDDTIYSGGVEVLGHFNSNTGITTPGGTSFDATVSSGGLLRVRLSGVASDTTIGSGGLEVVFSGGKTTDTTIDGGTLELQSDSMATGSITFGSAPGGKLQIDGTTMPTAVIKGFVSGDTIDLAGLDFTNGGSAQLSADNILHVIENGTSYNLQLDPSQDFSHESFQLSADSNGGTEITASSGLSINVTYDSTVTPANFANGVADENAFKKAMDWVTSYLDGTFSNTVTLNIDVSWGELGGLNLAPGSGASNRVAEPQTYTYDQFNDELPIAPAIEPSASEEFAIPLAQA